MKSVRRYEKELKEVQVEQKEKNEELKEKSHAAFKMINDRLEDVVYKIETRNEKKSDYLSSIHRRDQVRTKEVTQELHKLKH